jgi:hypothetical protein
MSTSIFTPPVGKKFPGESGRKTRTNTPAYLIYAPRGQCGREREGVKRETVSALRLKYISESNDTAPKIAAWGPANGAACAHRRCFATRGGAEKERVPGRTIFRTPTAAWAPPPPAEEIKMGSLIPKNFCPAAGRFRLWKSFHCIYAGEV